MRWRRRLAALGLLMVVACSVQGGPGRAVSPGPARAAAIAALESLDRGGAAFHVSTSVTGAGPAQSLSASGHFKRGNLELSSAAADLLIVDGVLYGERPGSGHWLEMNAEPGTFLWPAARPSLIWESLLLSPSSAVAPDQLVEFAGGLAGGGPDAFARDSRGDIRLHTSGSRLTGWEVVVDGPAGLRIDSVLTVGGSNAAEILPPGNAAAGNVLTLITSLSGTLA